MSTLSNEVSYDEQQRRKCRDANKPGQVIVHFEYERGLYDRGFHTQILRLKNTHLSTVKRVIREHFKSWSGSGSCTISSIDLGPFRENQLSKKQRKSFFDKNYKFNNNK